MRHLPFILLTLLLTQPLAAQQPAAAQPASGAATTANLAKSAEQELARSIQDLNQVRDQIANEKLPLAQDLTAQEEKLTQIRRKYADLTRQYDTGNLEMTVIRAEAKAKQDELSYINNLLDEYARTFETKINVSELQYLGDSIELAKQAPANPALSPGEKFGQQTAFVNISIKRAFDSIGGMRFAGVGVDSQGTVVEGQYAIIGPVALFRAKNGEAGVVIPQTNSTKPLIRPLEGDLQAGLASLVESGEGILPLDPSRGAALKALVQKTNLIHIFEKGGPIMWPLLVSSVVAMAVVLERLMFLFFERLRRRPGALDRFFAALKSGNTEDALRDSKRSKYYVVRALRYALDHRDQSMESALVYAQAKELKRYQRGIPVLDTVITLAPLLGLLGTVTGMMGSFSIIGGDLSAPGAITGGIAEALIATAFGLGVAITCLLPFNFLNAKIDAARHEIESAANQLTLMLRGEASAPTPLTPTKD